ncbi:MAG: 1-deoxy-D-xylulose-5-phosphate synthase, partial [Rickettsiales bacterium]|nr:1-deoxy-D-xylulose-5-phosphate synthase [Rickettsiales bacterium]
IAFRYPRGEGVGVALPDRGSILEIGKGRIIREGTQVAFLCLGTRLAACTRAADMLEADGISVTVADARFAKPFDKELLRRLLKEHALVVTVEDGSIGGFGAHVTAYASNAGWLGAKSQLHSLTLPDYFQAQNKPEVQYEEAGMGVAQLMDYVKRHLGAAPSIALASNKKITK